MPTHPLPGLHSVTHLDSLVPATDEYEFLRTRLLRERNRAVCALREAGQVVEETLASL